MGAYRAGAALAALAGVSLGWKIAPLLGRPPLHAAVLIGLNPLVLVFGVGGGHNDALVALALLGGTWLMLRDREMAGGAVIATAAAVKLSAGLVLPFLAIGARRRGRTIAGIVAATVVLFAIGFVAF